MEKVKFNKEFVEKLEEFGATVRINYPSCLYNAERNCLECNRVEENKVNWTWNNGKNMFDVEGPTIADHFTIFLPKQVKANIYTLGSSELDKEMQFVGSNIYTIEDNDIDSFITKSTYEQYTREVSSDLTICDNVIGNSGELAKTAYYYRDYKNFATFIRNAPSDNPIVFQDGGILYIEGTSLYDLYIVQNGVKTLIQNDVTGDLNDATITSTSDKVEIDGRIVAFNERGSFTITVTLGSLSKDINVSVSRDYLIGFTTRFVENDRPVLLFNDKKKPWYSNEDYHEIFIYSTRSDFKPSNIRIEGLGTYFTGETDRVSNILDKTYKIRIKAKEEYNDAEDFRISDKCYITYKNITIPGTNFKCVQYGEKVVGNHEKVTISESNNGLYTYTLSKIGNYTAEISTITKSKGAGEFADNFISAYLKEDHIIRNNTFTFNYVSSPNKFILYIYKYNNENFVHDPTNWKDNIYLSQSYYTVEFNTESKLRKYFSDPVYYLICCEGMNSVKIKDKHECYDSTELGEDYTLSQSENKDEDDYYTYTIKPKSLYTSITPSNLTHYFELFNDDNSPRVRFLCCSICEKDPLEIVPTMSEFLRDYVVLDPTMTNSISINNGGGSWIVSSCQGNINCSRSLQNSSSLSLSAVSNPEYLTTTAVGKIYIRRVFSEDGSITTTDTKYWKNQLGREVDCGIKINNTYVEDAVKIVEDEIVFDKVGLYKFHVQSSSDFYVSLGSMHDMDGIYFYDKFNDEILKNPDTLFFDGSASDIEVVLAFCMWPKADDAGEIHTNILVQDIEGNKALRKITWNSENLSKSIEDLNSTAYIGKSKQNLQINLRSDFGLIGESDYWKDITYEMRYNDIDESYRGYIKTILTYNKDTGTDVLSFPLTKETSYVRNILGTFRYLPNIYIIPNSVVLKLDVDPEGDHYINENISVSITNGATLEKLDKDGLNTVIGSSITLPDSPGSILLRTYVPSNNFIQESSGVNYSQEEVNRIVKPKELQVIVKQPENVTIDNGYIAIPTGGILNNFGFTDVKICLPSDIRDLDYPRSTTTRIRQDLKTLTRFYDQKYENSIYTAKITPRYSTDYSELPVNLTLKYTYKDKNITENFDFVYPAVNGITISTKGLNQDISNTFYGTDNEKSNLAVSAEKGNTTTASFLIYISPTMEKSTYLDESSYSSVTGLTVSDETKNNGTHRVLKVTLNRNNSKNNSITLKCATAWNNVKGTGNDYSTVTLKNFVFDNHNNMSSSSSSGSTSNLRNDVVPDDIFKEDNSHKYVSDHWSIVDNLLPEPEQEIMKI